MEEKSITDMKKKKKGKKHEFCQIKDCEGVCTINFYALFSGLAHTMSGCTNGENAYRHDLNLVLFTRKCSIKKTTKAF